jgi:PPOX class probable F420-dependent enzyme
MVPVPYILSVRRGFGATRLRPDEASGRRGFGATRLPDSASVDYAGPVNQPNANPIREALDADTASWARRHLAADIVGWLTTVAADGRLQSTPISFLWTGEFILLFSKPNTPKLRNIAAHPQVSFNLNSDEYADHYLVIEGTAAVDPTVAPSDVHPAYAAKYHGPLAHWEMDQAQTAREFSVPVVITPTRIRAS